MFPSVATVNSDQDHSVCALTIGSLLDSVTFPVKTDSEVSVASAAEPGVSINGRPYPAVIQL